MDSPLFCCIILTKYLFILFLDNIGAMSTLPSYVNSFYLTDIHFLGPYDTIRITENRLHLENMKFSISYGRITIKTVGILPSGEVYLGDSFIQGDPIRSIRVVDGKSTKKLLSVYNGNNIFSIVWYDLRYCKSNPSEEATFHLFIHPNGTLQFGFEFASDRTPTCDMILEVTDGFYNGSKDKIGRIVNEFYTKKIVYPSFAMEGRKMFTSIPLPN
uniref:SJCHGC06793 protein n=1 Tax=Schistosoma japonicum TaxID=6182 RepID=Q5DHS9_SCHJA|nr:SJCHGC06793 protein [Schistosoma japonicum]